MPFKTAIAHTLNKEAEDLKYSLQRAVCQLIPRAKSRHLRFAEDLSQMSLFSVPG